MRLLLWMSFSFFTWLSFAQSTGSLKESLTMDSKILGNPVKYSIYLPAGYETSQRRYPVLFLLHGYTDNETGWTQFGEVNRIADREMMDHGVTPMIIAMPDAGLDWYVNSFDGKTRYEDFFVEEFIPFIESNYQARGTKEFRAIAGLSMGGHGTLIYAFKYPHLFAAAAPLSAAAWTEEDILDIPQKDWQQYFGFIFGESTGPEDRINDHIRENMAYYLARDGNVDSLKQVRYYIDCGDDDFLINGNMELHRILLEKGVPHEFRVRDGVHDWTYWRTALPEVLKFVSESFHR